MTASEVAKSYGLKNLKEVSEHTGVSFQTLNNWHDKKPELFHVVCLGVVKKKGN